MLVFVEDPEATTFIYLETWIRYVLNVSGNIPRGIAGTYSTVTVAVLDSNGAILNNLTILLTAPDECDCLNSAGYVIVVLIV